MPSVYELKPRFQDLLRPLMMSLRDAGVTPNTLTLAAVGVSCATGLAIWGARTVPLLWLAVPLALFVRMALNAIDGMMARECHLESPLGQVLNEMGDVLSDAVIAIPYALHVSCPWPVVLFAFVALLVEFAGILGALLSGTRRQEGPMGKSDRALALGLMALLLYHWPRLGRFGSWYFSGISLLGVLTIVNRLTLAIVARKEP